MTKVEVAALGIGHGDAILLRQTTADGVWICLIDGGENPKTLQDALSDERVECIDLLVLSHLDSDHVGGLIGLTSHVRVKQYWGPALRAFQRHLWLFGDRGQQAIRRGEELEKELMGKGVDITYPLEGFTAEPVPGFRFLLLNPAARLIRSLLVGSDASYLIDDNASLGWLLEPEEEQQEQTLDQMDLNGQLARRFLKPEYLEGFSDAPKPLAGVDQEFFGDRFLNNTSLTLYADFSVGNTSRSALFPGDLESWTYVLGRNPMGLKADLLKASHHGGRVYLDGDASRYHEVLQSVRPRVCLVSANGRHGLPRNEFREAARLAGATVCCTSTRCSERIAGNAKDEDCCHKLYRCCEESHTTRVTFEESSISSDRAACLSGWGHDIVPVIQVQQHVIQPSPLVGRLLDNELRQHIQWVKKKLRALHEDRLATRTTRRSDEPFGIELIATSARQAGRQPVVTHIQQIVSAGVARAEFWGSDPGYMRHVYPLPKQDEVRKIVATLGELEVFTMPFRKELNLVDATSLLNDIDLDGFAAYVDYQLGYPQAVTETHFWPQFYGELRSSWNAFAISENEHGHRFWGVCFERSPSAPDIRAEKFRSVRKALGPHYGGETRWPVHVDSEQFGDGAAAFASAISTGHQLVIPGCHYETDFPIW